ncbi:hypothetical protein NKH15_07060 [Mesorhizobium caraganae]
MDLPPKPEPTEEPPVDAPTWTPDIREPDPDLLPDELPVPNPDENRDPPKRAVVTDRTGVWSHLLLEI